MIGVEDVVEETPTRTSERMQRHARHARRARRHWVNERVRVVSIVG